MSRLLLLTMILIVININMRIILNGRLINIINTLFNIINAIHMLMSVMYTCWAKLGSSGDCHKLGSAFKDNTCVAHAARHGIIAAMVPTTDPDCERCKTTPHTHTHTVLAPPRPSFGDVPAPHGREPLGAARPRACAAVCA